ncbi:class A beta-lactamase-related serine hydrolase [Peribacillus cavernae]|uniref:Class A beta-lactamase-related serine hydrolase n=1 Tax=Peribacillus cavernae TaxID=1674310 RepID=A0A3S0VJG3_9BACI|nr:serine hydrolase domain-containing protein [Peribacillus cavernae]MDQ0219883.1 CubicO group peptidase (beta-lactamase class C family) [Peribacillus cavernae]RUQ26632.1 class A beta-lactamase-related serine hydrolase [Peribacillus cavernae]
MKKTLYVVTAVLSISMVFSGEELVNAANEKLTFSTIVQKKELGMAANNAYPFTWDNPGPSSPVLQTGSVRSAGMVTQPLREIDRLIKDAIEQKTMPGAVVYAARQGVTVKHDAYGYAARYKDDQFTEIDEKNPMKKDTIFDLASISKVFTTTAAMKLYEQGKFDLDDPVAHYIPEFSQNGKSTVTIRQLMTHTSGFVSWIPLYKMGKNREDRIQVVFSQPLQNEPGTHYTYSDLNMITLGALVERLSGKRLDEYIKETITKPLKMNDTMYNPPASLKERIAATEYQPTLGRDLVWGEVHDENAWSLDGVAGHAGVFSTAADLAKFAHMFLQEGKYGRTRILQPETVKLLNENQNAAFEGDDHGLGWELQQGWYMDALTGSSTLGHTGYTGTSIVVSPANDTIAILLTNRVHPSRNTVSTNPTRRMLARQVADSIPVATPGRKPAWFSGYGDNLKRQLVLETELKQGAELSFKTWYRIEAESDYGDIEISTDGKHWTQASTSVTGSSGKWLSQSFSIPASTKFIRFTYKTDKSINGRGWYIADVKLSSKNGKVTPKVDNEGWILRNY